MKRMLENETLQKLVAKAKEAWQKAYAPYSNYQVGAAVLTESGEIFTGANVENAVYPLTICGERAAIFNAVSHGQKSFQAIAVVTRNGGTPCGSCRQVMAEFGMETLVLMANLDGEILQSLTVKELLPSAFGKADIQDS
jgi:cytidine deaminase